MALDSFDLYLAGWAFRTFDERASDSAARLTEQLAAVQLGEPALGYALGMIDQINGTPAKTRADLVAALTPLVLLGADSPGPGLPRQRYHALAYVPAWASGIMRNGGPVQLAPPVFVTVSYLRAGEGRTVDRRTFDLTLAIAGQDATARTPRSAAALAAEIARVLA